MLKNQDLSINPPLVGQDDNLNQVLLCCGYSLENIYSIVTEKEKITYTKWAVL